MSTFIQKIKKKYSIFDMLNIYLLLSFAFITIYPMFYVLVGAFSNGDAYSTGGVWFFPKQFTLSNIIVILHDEMLWYAFRNTILKTVVGTGLSLIFTSIVAYAMP